MGSVSSDAGFSDAELSAAANSKPVYSWDQAARQITRNVEFDYLPKYPSALTLTYSYRATDAAPAIPTGARTWIGSGFNSTSNGFQKFTAAQIATLDAWIPLIEEVANVDLVRVGSGVSGAGAYSDAGQILLGDYTTGSRTFTASGYANYIFLHRGTTYTRAGYVSLNGTESYVLSPSIDNYGFSVVIHEVLHTLGLSHPGDYQASVGGYSYAASAVYQQDSNQYSIMSYFAETDTGANWGSTYGSTLMLHDIAALQLLYGANMNTRTGDTVYGFNSNTGYDSYSLVNNVSRRAFTIWDAGGEDTLNLSGYSTGSKINLEQESFSSAGTRSDGGPMINNIAIARGAVVEDAIGGSGDDLIAGNSANNKLYGGAGNDKLTGKGGDDVIDGGPGIDVAFFSATYANAKFTTKNGYFVVSTPSDGTDSLVNVERLVFSDRTVAIDVAAGQSTGMAYRLYQAAFARTPDLAGLTFWTESLDTGRFNLTTAAQGFVGSPEFRSVYGTNPSAPQIVDRFYQNVLGRKGEQAGTDFWIGYIAKGGTIADVLTGFSESPENQARIAPIVGQGVTLDTVMLLT